MDQSDPNEQQEVVGVAEAAAESGQMEAYQSGTTVQPQTGFSDPQHQIAYQQAQQFNHQHHPHRQQNQQHEQLQAFWANQMKEVEETTDFKNHNLPLARIKKIMKADEDVRMISAEAPVVFAKACEMFILELTLQSWLHTEENKRRTLQKNDIAAAISRTDVFDFLVDIIPRDDLKEEGLGVTKTGIPMGETTADSIPYYYIPPHQQTAGPSGMTMGKPVVDDDDDGAMYGGGHQNGQPVAYMPWNSTQQQQHDDQQ